MLLISPNRYQTGSWDGANITRIDGAINTKTNLFLTPNAQKALHGIPLETLETRVTPVPRNGTFEMALY